MTTIKTSTNRSRLPGVPNARVGSMSKITPDDIGGASLREAMRLSQNMGMFGEQQVQWAHRMENDRIEALSSEGFVNASRDIAARRNELTTSLTGKEALNAPRLMDEFIRTRMDEERNKLDSDRAKKRFDEKMRSANLQTSATMDAHAIQENARYRQTAFQAENKVLIDHATASAGNNAAIRDNIAKMRQNIAELYRGQPDDFIRLEGNKLAMQTIEGVANALAVQQHPQAALDFLNSGIDREIGDGDLKVKFDMLRKKYEGAAESIEVANEAMAMAKDPEVTDAQLQEYAWEKYGKDKAKREQFLSIADDHRRRMALDDKQKLVDYQNDLWQQWYKCDYDLNSIPAEAKTDKKLYESMLSFGTKIAKAREAGMSGKSHPDYPGLLNVSKMPYLERLTFLSDAENHERVMLQCGGSQEIYKQVLQGKFQDYVNGGSAGAGSGAVKFDVGNALVNSWSIIQGSPGKGFLWNRSYNPKRDADKAFYSNFMAYYNDRMTDQTYMPNLRGDERAKETFRQLIRDINAGDLDMSKPTHEQFINAQSDISETKVDPKKLPYDQQLIARSLPEGEVIERYDEGSKTTSYFKRIDRGSPELDIAIRTSNPSDVLQAMSDGMEGDAQYEAGDYICYYPDGFVAVFTEAGVLRPFGDIDNGTYEQNRKQLIEGRREAIMQEAIKKRNDALSSRQPSRPSIMNTLQANHKDDYSEEWMGIEWRVEIPGRTLYIDGYTGDILREDPNNKQPTRGLDAVLD